METASILSGGEREILPVNSLGTWSSKAGDGKVIERQRDPGEISWRRRRHLHGQGLGL